jgi:hypothetical protein
MHYPFTLRFVGLFLGLALIGTHLLAAFKANDARNFLVRFPRWHAAGVALLTIDLVWGWYIAATMDWGEFQSWRMPILIFLPVAYGFMIYLVHEFLAARALGILMLLAAMPVLDAAFMKAPVSRLLVVVLAYLWVVLGLFWTSSPHLLRDHIQFVLRAPLRWTLGVWGGVAYGVLVLVFALRW